MAMTETKQKFKLLPYNTERIKTLCGVCNENISIIESLLQVKIKNRENTFSITGEKENVIRASTTIHKLYNISKNEQSIDKDRIKQMAALDQCNETFDHITDVNYVKLTDRQVYFQNKKQMQYLNDIQKNTVTFAYGPAGTGKTFLAVTAAIEALYKQEIKKIILVRPAVNAGESIGFLPGDINEKFNPYLQPFYDSLSSLLPNEKKKKYLSENTIEVAPIAFMRGRTLKNSFIILDEGQNTTIEQMKMILTRIGQNSKLCITGDPSQVDLPKAQTSGLAHARSILRNIDDIKHIQFDDSHVVRHQLIQKILSRYDGDKNEK